MISPRLPDAKPSAAASMPVSDGLPADGDEHVVGLERLAVSVLLDVDEIRLAFALRAGDFRAGADLEPLLPEEPCRLP